MGCIPTNSFDKYSLHARYFLHAIGCGDEPKCNDFEKLIMGGLQAISAVLKFVQVPFAGQILGSAFKQVALDEAEKYLSLDITKLDEFTQKVGAEYQQLGRHIQRHVIWNGFANFFWAKPYIDPEVRIRDRNFTKLQLNWIYFLVSLIDREKKGLKSGPIDIASMKPYPGARPGYPYGRVVLNEAMNIQKDRLADEVIERFKSRAWNMMLLLNESKLIDFDSNGEAITKDTKINALGLAASVIAIIMSTK